MKKIAIAVVMVALAVPGAAMAQFRTTTGSTSSSAAGSSVAGGGNVSLDGFTSGNASLNLSGTSMGNSLSASQRFPSSGSVTTSNSSNATNQSTGTTFVTRDRTWLEFMGAVFARLMGS